MNVLIIFKDGRADVPHREVRSFQIEDGFVIITDDSGDQVGYNADEVRSFALIQTRSAGGVDSRTPTQ